MARVVVGWKLTDDEACALCGATASVIVTDNGWETFPACDDCVPPGTTRDLITEAFERALQAEERG